MSALRKWREYKKALRVLNLIASEIGVPIDNSYAPPNDPPLYVPVDNGPNGISRGLWLIYEIDPGSETVRVSDKQLYRRGSRVVESDKPGLGVAAIVTIDGWFIECGGFSGREELPLPTVVTDVSDLNIRHQWPGMIIPRKNHTLIELENGYVMAIGGVDKNDNFVRQCEILFPDIDRMGAWKLSVKLPEHENEYAHIDACATSDRGAYIVYIGRGDMEIRVTEEEILSSASEARDIVPTQETNSAVAGFVGNNIMYIEHMLMGGVMQFYTRNLNTGAVDVVTFDVDTPQKSWTDWYGKLIMNMAQTKAFFVEGHEWNMGEEEGERSSLQTYHVTIVDFITRTVKTKPLGRDNIKQ